MHSKHYVHLSLILTCSNIHVQALRSKYFLVGQNLNTSAQSTSVSRPNQPVAGQNQPVAGASHPIAGPLHVKQTTNAAAQQLNGHNQENSKLSKTSYKKVSTSSQFGHVMNDVSSSNAGTRQPTPGISESMALFDTSLENFKTSKSNLTSITGSKSDREGKSLTSIETEQNNYGAFSKSKKNYNSHLEHGYQYSNHSSKFTTSSQQPNWQSGTTTTTTNTSSVSKPPLEQRRTSYNPVALGAGKQHYPGKANVNAAVGDGEGNASQARTWGRNKKESVADVEKLMNEMGHSGFESYARKHQDGYVCN